MSNSFQENPLFIYDYPLKITKKIQAPCCPGVYFFTTIVEGVEVPYYIGSSKFLKSRISNHGIWNTMVRNGIFYSAYVLPCLNYQECEVQYIKLFKPINNTAHNRGK